MSDTPGAGGATRMNANELDELIARHQAFVDANPDNEDAAELLASMKRQRRQANLHSTVNRHEDELNGPDGVRTKVQQLLAQGGTSAGPRLTAVGDLLGLADQPDGTYRLTRLDNIDADNLTIAETVHNHGERLTAFERLGRAIGGGQNGQMFATRTYVDDLFHSAGNRARGVAIAMLGTFIVSFALLWFLMSWWRDALTLAAVITAIVGLFMIITAAASRRDEQDDNQQNTNGNEEQQPAPPAAANPEPPAVQVTTDPPTRPRTHA